MNLSDDCESLKSVPSIDEINLAQYVQWFADRPESDNYTSTLSSAEIQINDEIFRLKKLLLYHAKFVNTIKAVGFSPGAKHRQKELCCETYR